MTVSGFWSICVLVSFAALAWLAFGVGGLACLIVGVIISQLDVGHIEVLAHAQPHAAAAGVHVETDAVQLDGDALPRRDVAWRAVPIPPPPGVVKKDTSSPLKPRWRKLPANVVVLKARKVS